MDDWLGNIFSGDPTDLGRVGWWGVALMVAGLFTSLLSQKIASALHRPAWDVPIKLVGVALLMLGALGAVRAI